MDFFAISTITMQQFLLVLFRVGAILFFVPILGDRQVPPQVKAGLSLLIAVCLFPTLDRSQIVIPSHILIFTVALSTEIMLGITLGLLTRMLFGSVQLAGRLMGIQMGFGMVNVMDPITGIQVSIISHFQELILTLVFLSINAHHYFIEALAATFQIIPPLGISLPGTLQEIVITAGSHMFYLSVKIAAPVMVTITLTYFAMGIISKTVPAMNILIVGLPVTIGLGLIMLMVTIPVLISFLQGEIQMLEESFFAVIKAIAP